MNLSQKELLEIVRLVETSRFEICELQVGDFRLILSNQALEGTPSGTGSPGPSPVAPEERAPQVTPSPEPQLHSDSDRDLLAIDAPVVGVFYRRPEPGAPPFVEVGSYVDEDTTVGLIEVMKVFNAVKAGVKGTVEAIYADDQQLVEYGETLMGVRPEEGGTA